MVCMSSFPTRASALLRRGSRFAGRLNTDWFVVYVETPREAPHLIDAEAQRHLLANAESARELGAEVVHLKADDPVPALLDFARSHGVGQIIVGRSRAAWWRQLLGRTVAMRLVQEAEGFDVLHRFARRGAGAMTLRARILLAQTPLAGALLLIAILSAFTNAALGRNAASILQDNYRSVLAAERMKEALERIDSAAMFIVAGERARGVTQASQNFQRFEREMAVQRSNITERGEPEATTALLRDWMAYRAAFDQFIGETDHAALEARYFATMNPLFIETKDAADRILDLNQDAMVRKRDLARRAAKQSSAAMIATALLASLIGLGASIALTRRILRPLSVLGATARRLGEGDMEVRANVSRHDEIGTLARDFNLMADRLEQYRHSSLGSCSRRNSRRRPPSTVSRPGADLRS